MRPLTVVVTSLAGASAVALVAYSLGQAHAPHGPVHPILTASAASSEKFDDTAKLNEAMGQLNRRLAALEVKQVQAKPAESEDPTPLPNTGVQQSMDLETMKQKALERAAAIDVALKTEATDSLWSSPTVSQLQTAVARAVKEDGAQFSIKSVKCLTSICEMVLSASSPDQLVSTDVALAPRISGMGSADIAPPEIAADGSATVTYRLFRQGYPRPDDGT